MGRAISFPVTVRIAKAFYFDHVQRELPAGEVVKVSHSTVTVKLDRVAYEDLIGDADYYRDMKGSDDYEENKVIVNSAIRVWNVLMEVGR